MADKPLQLADNMEEQLLAILSVANQALSLSDIQKQTERNIPDRTLRRWLSHLVETNKIIKLGSRRDAKYVIVKNEPHLLSDSIFSAEAQTIIQKVQAPLYKRDPIGYQNAFLESYQPNKTYYLTQPQQALLQQAAGGKEQDLPAGTYIKQIYNRFLIDLSFNSSRLEGNTYSLLDTERLLLQGEGADDKLDEEKIMILNHKEAIRWLVDNANRYQLTPDELYTLHYLLADGLVLTKHAGKLREEGVRISASVYIPLENQTIIAATLLKILNTAKRIINPFEQSLFLLAQLAYLQPFIDVNKRTSRLMANLPLIKHNLVPLAFNDVNKDDYIFAMLAIYEYQNILPLKELYIYSYLRTCKAYEITMASMQSFDALRVKYRPLRRETIRYIIQNKIIGQKLLQTVQIRSAELSKEHQEKFLIDTLTDLKEMAPHRMAGLGISAQELATWLKLAPLDGVPIP